MTRSTSVHQEKSTVNLSSRSFVSLQNISPAWPQPTLGLVECVNFNISTHLGKNAKTILLQTIQVCGVGVKWQCTKYACDYVANDKKYNIIRPYPLV